MAKITFREDRCKGCKLCISICPKNIITMSTKLNIKGHHSASITADKMKECLGCAACAKMCPDSVITVEK